MDLVQVTTDLGLAAKKIEDLQRRYQKALERKSAVKALLEDKRKELAALFKEIQAEGYDPKNLPEELDKLMKDLWERVTAFETDLARVEGALDKYESATTKPTGK